MAISCPGHCKTKRKNSINLSHFRPGLPTLPPPPSKTSMPRRTRKGRYKLFFVKKKETIKKPSIQPSGFGQQHIGINPHIKCEHTNLEGKAHLTIIYKRLNVFPKHDFPFRPQASTVFLDTPNPYKPRKRFGTNTRNPMAKPSVTPQR